MNHSYSTFRKLYTFGKLIFVFLSFTSCKQEPKLFTRLTASETGIDFRNDINESDSLNVLSFEYIYNGGGVGVGDVNNDGKPDVFLAGNMVSSKLYLNVSSPTAEGSREQVKFKDITDVSKTTTKYWCTGVSMVDVNQDGWLDIYVLTAFPQKNKPVPNILFLNEGLNKDGVPTFREAAAELGLADSSYATQAAFFDYDLDGDLDVYLCNNSHEDYNRNEITGQRTDGTGNSQDKLLRNSPLTPRGGYTDVSKQAGIQTEGWGLGVVVKDFNADGWPDIYVANDFQSNDHLYINNQNGTFSNQIADYLAHQSHNSMGVDMADFNNDGLEDLCVVDMLPDDNLRQKTMFPNVAHDKYNQQARRGYQPQFVRNMLQLNNGPRPQQPHSATFSDVGYMAGVAATDWSWSPLFADFDMDGWRDLLITNGYVKDITDLDFMSYSNEYNMFGTPEERSKKLQAKAREIGEVKKPNCLFINNKNLTFDNKAEALGLPEKTFTNGTAYADFDNDGDLDIIMNNLNDEAFVYQNNSRSPNQLPESSYLKIKLLGNVGNLEGIGAKVTLWHKNQTQYAEHALQRGYLSTMENMVYFGLGQITQLDSVEIQWPLGKRQILKNVAANQTLLLKEKEATLPARSFVSKSEGAVFQDITKGVGLDFQPQENEFMDFNYQPTLMQRYSMQGPQIATGDVNGDGLEDFYVAGASRQSGYFFIQTVNGFVKKALTNDPKNKLQEETGVLLFDADGDQDLDLYCVAGGSEFGEGDAYQDLLFLNDGRGNFTQTPNALPNTTASGSCVVAADYDQDGDLDLFVGGRVVPKKWPQTPKSYILRNDSPRNLTPPRNEFGTPLSLVRRGEGVRFTDVTAQRCPQLAQAGMVTAATWTDIDNDKDPDLVIAGEWTGIQIFENNKGKLDILPLKLDYQNGFWHSLAAADFDHDGDVDLVAGNLGLNTRYKASVEQPVTVRAKDFDANGSYDAITSLFIQGKEHPTHPRNTLAEQVISTKRKTLYYRKYGEMNFDDLFDKDQQQDMQVLQATQTASVYIENQGNGKFLPKPLPTLAQVAPMQSILSFDFDQDGHLDIVAVGNSYAHESLTGRYDASQGWVLRGDGKGNFTPIPASKSGFLVQGDARSLVKISHKKGEDWLIVGLNQAPLRCFEWKKLPNQ